MVLGMSRLLWTERDGMKIWVRMFGLSDRLRFGETEVICSRYIMQVIKLPMMPLSWND